MGAMGLACRGMHVCVPRVLWGRAAAAAAAVAGARLEAAWLAAALLAAGYMAVQFITDASISKAGFKLEYTTAEDPPTDSLNCTASGRVGTSCGCRSCCNMAAAPVRHALQLVLHCHAQAERRALPPQVVTLFPTLANITSQFSWAILKGSFSASGSAATAGSLASATGMDVVAASGEGPSVPPATAAAGLALLHQSTHTHTRPHMHAPAACPPAWTPAPSAGNIPDPNYYTSAPAALLEVAYELAAERQPYRAFSSSRELLCLPAGKYTAVLFAADATRFSGWDGASLAVAVAGKALLPQTTVKDGQNIAVAGFEVPAAEDAAAARAVAGRAPGGWGLTADIAVGGVAAEAVKGATWGALLTGVAGTLRTIVQNVVVVDIRNASAAAPAAAVGRRLLLEGRAQQRPQAQAQGRRGSRGGAVGEFWRPRSLPACVLLAAEPSLPLPQCASIAAHLQACLP
jgi:hypothetical protein